MVSARLSATHDRRRSVWWRPCCCCCRSQASRTAGRCWLVKATATIAFTGLVLALAAAAALFVATVEAGQVRRGVGIDAAFYSVNLDCASEPQLCARFVQSAHDAATDEFLSSCQAATKTAAGRTSLQARHKLSLMLQQVLGWSRVDASASVRDIQLFPTSQQQLRHVMASIQSGHQSTRYRTILDIGAGAGSVTQTVASVVGVSAGGVTTVETSLPHRHSLAQRGYHSLSSVDEVAAPRRFDAVLLFHILDRCDSPRQLLVLAAALEFVLITSTILLLTIFEAA